MQDHSRRTSNQTSSIHYFWQHTCRSWKAKAEYKTAVFWRERLKTSGQSKSTLRFKRNLFHVVDIHSHNPIPIIYQICYDLYSIWIKQPNVPGNILLQVRNRALSCPIVPVIVHAGTSLRIGNTFDFPILCDTTCIKNETWHRLSSLYTSSLTNHWYAFHTSNEWFINGLTIPEYY